MIEDSKVKCFSQKEPIDIGGAKKETIVPVVVDFQPKVQESLWTKYFKPIQSFLEENSGVLELEGLKQGVQAASDRFDSATHQVTDRRAKVVQAQEAHDQAHKKHVNLLMRRDAWNEEDAQNFVQVTSEEVHTRQALLEAQTALRHTRSA